MDEAEERNHQTLQARGRAGLLLCLDGKQAAMAFVGMFGVEMRKSQGLIRTQIQMQAVSLKPLCKF